MAKITITIPAAKAQLVAEAVAGTYDVEPTAGGVKSHLVAHLKETVAIYARTQAHRAADTDQSDAAAWGDLVDPPEETPAF